jgi:hypothetical protein
MRYAPLLLILGLLTAPAFAEGNANFVLGWRGLNEDFWSPVDDQLMDGATADFGKENWPVHLAIGVYSSAAEKGEWSVVAATFEASFGVLKVWNVAGNTHPFVGGGLSFVFAAAEVESGFGWSEDDDNSGAVYAQGGIFWRLGRRFNIGVDARLLTGSEIELFGEKGDADYFQFGLLLGFGWPATK